MGLARRARTMPILPAGDFIMCNRGKSPGSALTVAGPAFTHWAEALASIPMSWLTKWPLLCAGLQRSIVCAAAGGVETWSRSMPSTSEEIALLSGAVASCLRKRPALLIVAPHFLLLT